MRDTQAFREQIGRIEELVQNIELTADPSTRATAKELIQAVMDLHGAAVERTLEIVTTSGEAGTKILRSLGTDELVGSLLVLYDLHPEDFATRIRRGVEKAQQVLTRRAASVQLLGIENGTVQLRLYTGGHSCGSTTAELQAMVRAALFETAPDAAEILIELALGESATGFVPLDSLKMSNGSGVANVVSRP